MKEEPTRHKLSLTTIRARIDAIEAKLKQLYPLSKRVLDYIEAVQTNHLTADRHTVTHRTGKTVNDPVCACHTCDCEYCTKNEYCIFCGYAEDLKHYFKRLSEAEKEELERLKNAATNH